MILYIYKEQNNALVPVSVIDYATSIIWVKRYSDAGEFELYLPATADLLTLFASEVFIARDDDDTVMVAESIDLDTDAENGDFLTIRGRSAESLLGRRVIPKQTNFTDTSAEEIMRSLVTQNVISPTAPFRKIAEITLGESKGFTDMIARKQVTGKNLLDTIKEMADEQNYGFALRWQKSSQMFEFEVYKGVDRSFDQSVNPPVVFSPEFENLGNTSYSNDRSTYYNNIYVAGQGEGSDRVIEMVHEPRTYGIGLREMWVDARNTSSRTDGGELTPIQYASVLNQMGQEQLAASKDTTSFSGKILDYNVYTYGVDYGLGDKVQIVNEYGIKGTATVTEITEVEDEEGYRMYPTLSAWEA